MISFPVVPEGYYTISNVKTNSTLDDLGSLTEQGSKVAGWEFNGGANQIWHISAGNNDNTYHLKAKNFDAGTWLGVANDAQGESLIVNKAPVEWTIIMVDPNNHQSPYFIVSPNGLRMDLAGSNPENGTTVLLWTQNGLAQSLNQQWKLSLSQPIDILNGGAYAVQNEQTGTMLYASGTDAGAPVIGLHSAPDLIWHWNFQPSTNSYFVVNSKDETTYLSVQNDAAGTERELSTLVTSKTAYHWILRQVFPTDPRLFYIYSGPNGLVVDLTGGNTADGTPVILYHKHPDSDGKNQRWRFLSNISPGFPLPPN